MSKVLVDRELLQQLLDEGPRSVTWAAQEQARALLAQPAEAEGVRDYLTEFAEGEVEAKTAIEELQDALSAVTAERDRLRALIAECAEYLNTDRETTIGSGSILHRQMIAAMAAKEA